MIVTGQSKCTIALSQRFLANSMGSAPFYKYKLVFLMIKADKQKIVHMLVLFIPIRKQLHILCYEYFLHVQTYLNLINMSKNLCINSFFLNVMLSLRSSKCV